MGKNTDKFLLLMWKNFLLQWRHPIQTVVEILAPLLLAALLVIIRSVAPPQDNSARIYTPLPVTPSYMRSANISWSPDHPELEKIVKDAVEALKEIVFFNEYTITKHKDSKELEAFLIKEINQNDATWGSHSMIAGIQFDDSLFETNDLPSFANITLRFPSELEKSYYWETWETDSLFPMFQQGGPRAVYNNEGGPPSYKQSGFLALQQEISYSLIKYFKSKHGQNEPFNRTAMPIYMQRFPYPKWIEDIMLIVLQSLLPQKIMLSFIYTAMTTVKAIAIEKEKQLKEIMKIMGLPGWLHWVAWFVKTFVLIIIPIIFLTVLYTVKWTPRSDLAIFTNSNPFLVFLFFVFYTFSTITFCFAISSFFSKANTASVIAALMWFLTYLPFSLSQTSYKSLSLFLKLFLSLFSNTAMGYGIQLILMFEGNGEGIQFHNLWKTASPDDELVLGHLLIMLAFDTILYLLITLYVEAVFPGEYGVPLPWYFSLTASYWCGKPQIVENENSSEENMENKFFENEPTHLKIGVNVQNLRKQFSSKNVAVKGLTLNLFEDQITVLLGHNGAGKTTTMSMLTGMIPPTSGTATVGGYDIRTNIAGVRDSLGLCPQHNILFDELTVKEHLYFYSRLKGLEKEELNKEIDKFIKLLELNDKGEAKSATLSGGMKRKLSVAIALAGDSSVVMCDEPSSGMDPSARRALWDLLQSQKKGRTILLTTHFMDEADLLGDRIAIMAGGELKCCGSSYFLKKKYGAGYRLIMDKSQQCDINQVTNLLQKYIPNIKIETNIGSELTYILNEEQSSVFEEMLRDLETHSNNLGVLSYGISITNFDEVFMKVSTGNVRDNIIENERNSITANGGGDTLLNSNNSNNFTEFKVNINEQKYNYLSGFSLWCNQFLAMLMKKGLSTLRSWIFFVIQICISIIPLILIMILIRTLGTVKNLPSLKISLDSYNDPITVITSNENNNYAEKYMKYLNENDKTLIDWKNINMTEKMIEESVEKRSSVLTSYIAGAEFTKKNITAFFNNNPFHSTPLSLQLTMNAILKKEVSEEYSLQIHNYPLPFTEATKENQQSHGSNIIGVGFQFALILGFSMAFVSPFYVMFYIRERFSKAKHLQFVSGVEVIPFWLSSFICDLLMYLFLSTLIVIMFIVFKQEGLTTGEELGRLFLVFLYFGYSMLPMMYLASYRFQTAATGYTKMVFFNILAGLAVFLLLHFCKGILDEYSAYDPLHFIFLFVPLYSFCTGIRNIIDLYSIREECHILIENCINIPGGCGGNFCEWNSNCCPIKDYYDMGEPGIGSNIFISFLIGTIFIAILLGIDYHWFEIIYYKTFYKKRPPVQQENTQEDVDVYYEKEKIRKAVNMQEINKYNFLMHNITKYYNNFLAVNNICLGVNQYECFGLLGVNGAGKTTTFKMMTGDIKCSYGDAWINGLNLKTELKKIYRMIGYCPQFDALLDDLTCRETIIIFGLLRGITLKESKKMAKKLARDFDFYAHLDKYVKQLSGGNKRKLSTAIALIGDPLVIYLDEPTTGMDPATKRYLWNELCKIRDKGKCIILTSHSMEECEALCTRLAIMVNGQFMCLGSTQHLKNKFSEGYTLTIRIRSCTVEEQQSQNLEMKQIETFVKENFSGAVIREKYQELITFHIADKSQPWSKMFGIMERGKKSLNIEDYSLGQSSLEQVFLSFTKYQQFGVHH